MNDEPLSDFEKCERLAARVVELCRSVGKVSNVLYELGESRSLSDDVFSEIEAALGEIAGARADMMDCKLHWPTDLDEVF